MLRTGIQIPHGTQAAVAHIVSVLVIGNIRIAVVIIGFSERKSRIIAVFCVIFGSRNSGLSAGRTVLTRGLIKNNIDDYPDSDCFAARNHGFKFIFAPQLRIKLITYRLITCPPLSAFYCLLRRACFDIPYTLRTVCFLAFVGNCVPRLFKRDNIDRARITGRIFRFRRSLQGNSIRRHGIRHCSREKSAYRKHYCKN